VIDKTTLLVTVAIATLLLPIVFLIAVAYAAGRRRRGIPITPRLSAFLTVLGGMTIGVFLLTGADALLILLPILASGALLTWFLWRRRKRVQAGQLLVGMALPWVVLWTNYLGLSLSNPVDYPIAAVLPWLGLGIAALLGGVLVVRRGDPPPPAPDPNARAGDPGSRSFGNVTAAIREPGRVGPFGTSELAALTAFVIVWIVVPLLMPSDWPRIVGFVLSVLVGAVVATEAYIRAIPSRSRRAWEAFSWLGEHELRAAGDSASDPVPTTRAQAADWLERHPDTPDRRWIRVEVLLLAGRLDDAKAAAATLPDGTPAERWLKAATVDLADWSAGGDGNVDGMRAAAADLEPADGDERLRAEVSIATAEVRRRMADGRATPGDALDPLLEVRQRLGRRADGQVGRALRMRMLATSFVVGLVFGGLLYVLGPSAGSLF